ncbi:MAG: RdgB/HAM1 family non-canonical purine NTP pyrophosphatase [Sphaerochaetaceae bacterium]
MKLLFASNNEHKKIEMSALFKDFEIISPKDLNIEFDYEENESTFVGNALGKAQALYELAKIPTFADDSGLAVEALNGGPGIYSARYGFELHNRLLESAERNAFLLKNLEHVDNRRAHFICAIALIYSPTKIYVVQESLEGRIATEPFGMGGFGYDPIFLVGENNKTMASYSQKEKNKISHRALAAKRMVSIIKELQ